MEVFDEIERLRDQRTIGSLMRYLLDSNILRAYTTKRRNFIVVRAAQVVGSFRDLLTVEAFTH